MDSETNIQPSDYKASLVTEYSWIGKKKRENKQTKHEHNFNIFITKIYSKKIIKSCNLNIQYAFTNPITIEQVQDRVVEGNLDQLEILVVGFGTEKSQPLYMLPLVCHPWRKCTFWGTDAQKYIRCDQAISDLHACVQRARSGRQFNMEIRILYITYFLCVLQKTYDTRWEWEWTKEQNTVYKCNNIHIHVYWYGDKIGTRTLKKWTVLATKSYKKMFC